MKTMRISTKLLLIMAGVASVFSIAAGITFYSLSQSEKDASIVNALGRQRMLTQAMAKSVVGYTITKDNASFLEEYKTSRTIFSQTLEAVKNGGSYPSDLKMTRYETIKAIQNKLSQVKITEIEKEFSAFSKAVDKLLSSSSDAGQSHQRLGKILTEANRLRKLSNDLVSIYTEIADQNHSNIYYTMLVTLVLIIVMLLLSILFFKLFVLSRLQMTVDSMKEIARGDGDLSRRLDDSIPDELGQFANAFNTFTEKIQTLVMRAQDSGGRLNEASSKLESFANQTNQGIVQQQEEIVRIATAMNQMAASVQEVSRSSTSAHENADSAELQARNGQDLMSNTMRSINELSSGMEKISEVINHLDQEGERIGTVLDVIRGVAEQTNLLALNAAIEAARAGEQGRGFAVVADEVRTLASRTQSSTRDIQEMIENLQQRTSQAVAVMQENQIKASQTLANATHANDSLDNINLTMSGIKEMGAQIASATEEQSMVAEEINRNIHSINQLAGKTAETTGQLSGNAAELSFLAKQLDQQVSQFKI